MNKIQGGGSFALGRLVVCESMD